MFPIQNILLPNNTDGINEIILLSFWIFLFSFSTGTYI